MSEPSNPVVVDTRQLHDLVRAANRIRSPQLPPGEFLDFTRTRDAVLDRQDRPFIHLYAAAGVVARDIDMYLTQHPDEPQDLYATLMMPIIEEDREQYPNTTMFGKIPPEPLPMGFAEAAVSGAPTLAELDDPGIIHEWTSKPGKRIYTRFGEKFQETICGPNGPYEQFGGKVAPVLGPAAIVQAITSGLSVAAILIPLLVLIAVLIVKTGLKTYCEPERHS